MSSLSTSASISNIIAGTGHRPPRLGLSYSRADLDKLTSFIVSHIRARTDYAPGDLSIISGMALGWDQAIALAAIELNLPFTAAIPFDGQCAKWPQPAQDLYHFIAYQATHIICLGSRSDVMAAFQARDYWMVDNATEMLTLYNGDSYGGTFKTLQYAKAKNKPVTNLWSKWLKFRSVK